MSKSIQPPSLMAYQGARGGGLTNERPGTDLVILGPMRGLEINYMGRGHSKCKFIYVYTYRNSIKESAKGPIL